jgi:putative oxidoreductase
MNLDIREVTWIVARVLTGVLFVRGGIEHFSILPGLTQAVAARHIPAPRFVVVLGSVFQIVAGVAFMLGFYTQWAALGLILFTVVASLMLLNFWSMEGPARENAIRTWYANLAIIGGLLVAALYSMH